MTGRAPENRAQGAAPAGWYAQPDGSQRYWDGSSWTQHVAPGPSTAVPISPAPTKNWFLRHKVLTGLMGLVLLFVLIGAFSGGRSSTPTAGTSVPSPAAPPTASPTAPSTPGASPPMSDAASGLNTPVRDGKFEFTVTGVETGKTQIGDQYLNTKAQGQFVLVSVTVTNIGQEPQTVFDANMKAFDANGRQFAADSKASLYLGDEGKLWVTQINPGNTVKGKIVFDIPKDAQLTTLQLHDSAFSSGVKVQLK